MASTLWLGLSILRRRKLRNAGYGITALLSLDQGKRRISAEVVRIPDLAHSWGAGNLVERSFTVVTVPHTGHLPNSIAYRGSDVDDESLTHLIPEWRFASEGTESLIGVHALSFVRGYVAIEPEQIKFVEAGDLLEPDYLREVVEKLVNIGEWLEQDISPGFPTA